MIKIFKQWLIHSSVLLLIFNILDFTNYWYDTHFSGMHLFLADGTTLTQWQRFLSFNYDQSIWPVTLCGTFLVELNYHFIFRKRRMTVFLILGLASACLFMTLLLLFKRLTSGLEGSSFISPVLVLTAYIFVYAFIRDFFYQRITKAGEQVNQAQTELAALKAQISPHFFFNTLNSIYGTAIHENAEKTAVSIERLSGIMRYTISEAQNDFTPITDELKFIEDYIQLQLARIPQKDSIHIGTNFYNDEKSIRIAPLLLIPFIENAFKYGVSIDHPCFITLDLKVLDHQLDLSLKNTLFSSRPHQPGLGTGIQNTKKRLELIYPKRHKLVCEELDGYYSVNLHIDLF